MNGTPPGYRIVTVDMNSREGVVKDFIYNTQGGPASAGSGQGLERPIDAKFGPDGLLYILDFGRARFKHSKIETWRDTGKIFVCLPSARPTTQP